KRADMAAFLHRMDEKAWWAKRGSRQGSFKPIHVPCSPIRLHLFPGE
ncbi:hypothetical protein EVA_21861, partial [gut metagenome]